MAMIKNLSLRRSGQPEGPSPGLRHCLHFAKCRKVLRWRTPHQINYAAWTKDRSIFKIDPAHSGPHT